ncbi:MAG: hypothetical protein MJY59_03745 [Bacteroidaceae bacterium]|nr:hypothetical protein [Bacteroidaceae bacterium]
MDIASLRATVPRTVQNAHRHLLDRQRLIATERAHGCGGDKGSGADAGMRMGRHRRAYTLKQSYDSWLGREGKPRRDEAA